MIQNYPLAPAVTAILVLVLHSKSLLIYDKLKKILRREKISSSLKYSFYLSVDICNILILLYDFFFISNVLYLSQNVVLWSFSVPSVIPGFVQI